MSRFLSVETTRLKMAFAAFVVAALATAITQLISPHFVESPTVRIALDSLFIGTFAYLGLTILERTWDSQ